MKKLFSTKWNSSSQARKQRKYQKNAPLNIKRRFLNSPLSKELKAQFGTRSMPVKTGDTVKITTGQFKGQSGKVTKVSVSRTFTHVEGATLRKKDGTDAFYPVHPSNLLIEKLNLDDKLREAKLKSFNEAKN